MKFYWLCCLFCVLVFPYWGHAQENFNSFEIWEPKGGCWEFKDSMIYGRAYWGLCKLIHPHEFTDFVFKARLAKVEESGPISLLFRYDDQSDVGYHCYVFPFSSVTFSRIQGSRTEYLYSATSEIWRHGLNVWNTILIESAGATFNIYINDVFIFSHIDYEFSQGKLLLMVQGDPRQFAKFQILEIKSK